MTKMNGGECAELFNQNCQQKVDRIISEVEELISKSVDGNSEMRVTIKQGLVGKLLEGTSFHIVRDGVSEAVIFEMASAVLPDGQQIDLFQAIVDGKKRIDVRARTPEYLTVKIGDVAQFKRISDGQIEYRKIELTAEVKPKATMSECFSELVFWVVKDFGIIPKDGLSSVERACSLIIPGVKTIEDLETAILSFPGNAVKIERYGLIAFLLRSLTAQEIEDYAIEHYGWHRKIIEGKSVLTRSTP